MLTRKQHELLLFIHERLKESGIPPSFDEMKDALELASKSGIHRLITALEERGFIRRLPNRARALEVLRLPDSIAQGLNPARKGTPGGGSGGAIYTDVNTQRLRVAGTLMSNNKGRASSGAVFFVSNHRKGRLSISRSTLTHNPDPAHSLGLPGIFHLGRPAGPTIVSSVIN